MPDLAPAPQVDTPATLLAQEDSAQTQAMRASGFSPWNRQAKPAEVASATFDYDPGWAASTAEAFLSNVGSVTLAGRRAIKESLYRGKLDNMLARWYGAPEDWGDQLTPDEANRLYAIPGDEGMRFKEPVTRFAAMTMRDKRMEDLRSAWIMGHGNTSTGRELSMTAAALVGGFLDPVNIAASFVPGIGEERWAQMIIGLGKIEKAGTGVRIASRLAAGGFGGVQGYALTQPLVEYQAFHEQSDYDWSNLAEGFVGNVALSAILHTGFGAIRDRMGRMQIQSKQAAFRAAMNDVLNDRPVVTPSKIINLDPEVVMAETDTTGMKPEQAQRVTAEEQQRRIEETIKQRQAEIRRERQTSLDPRGEDLTKPAPTPNTDEARLTAAQKRTRELREQMDMLPEQKPSKISEPVYEATDRLKAEDFKLPKELAGAAPRFGYGDKQFTLEFASPLDKALYIIAKEKPSARDSDYLGAVMAHTGMDEAQARTQGKVIAEQIKSMAKEAKAGALKVEQIYETPHAHVEAAPEQVAQATDLRQLLIHLSAHPDEFASTMAQNLLKVAHDERLNVPVRWSTKGKRAGEYNIDRDFIKFHEAKATPIVQLHEAFHALTSRQIDRHLIHLDDAQGRDYLNGLSEFIAQSADTNDAAQQSVAELAKSYLYFVEHRIMPEFGSDFIEKLNTREGEATLPYYGLRDLHEFVDEAVTNQKFQQVLMDTPSPIGKKSVYQWFVDSVKKLLGFEGKDGGLLERVLDEGAALASQPDTAAGGEGRTVGSAETPEEKPALEEAIGAQLLAADMERRQVLNQMAFTRIIDSAKKFSESAKVSLGEGLRQYLVGSERMGESPSKEGTGGGRSLDSDINARYRLWVGDDLMNTLEREGLLDMVKARDPKIDLAVFKEFDELRPGGKPGSSGSPQAARIAAIVRNLQHKMNEELRLYGADIAEREDYRIRQSYDATEVRRIGYEQFRSDFLDHLDIGKTFVGLDGTARDVEQTMKNAYRGIITGLHGPLEDIGLSGGVTEGGNVAEKMNQPRLFHFKSGESAFFINQKYAQRDLLGAVLAQIRSSAHSVAILDRLGANPDHAFRQARMQLLKDAAKADDFDKQMASVNAKSIDNAYHTVMGHFDNPANVTLAKVASGIRALMNMKNLGSVILSTAGPDRVFSTAEMSFQGIKDPFSKSMSSLVPASPEAKAMGRSMGAGIDGFLGHVAGQFNDAADNRWAPQRWAAKMMSMTGYSKMNDAVRVMLVNAMSNNLAEHAHLSLRDMETSAPDVAKMLRHYDISAPEWDALRSQKSEVNGIPYITPEMARSIPDEQMDAILKSRDKAATPYTRARAASDLQTKLAAFFVDRADHGDPRANASDRALLLAGTQAGTPLGEVVRMAGQFKQWPVAIMRALWGREIYGSGSTSAKSYFSQGKFANWRIAQLTAMTIIGGYVSRVAHDLMDGKTPADPRKLATWRDAAVRGGGMGIAGDMLFREYGRSYDGIFKEAAGPSLGQIPDILNATHDLLVGKPAGSKDSRFYGVAKLLEGNILKPAANLAGGQLLKNTLYIKPALDYLVLWNLNEMLHPGGFRRTQDFAKEEFNQSFFLKPTNAPSNP